MKKIFTFILLAISTLAMAQTFPSDPGTLKAPAASTLVYDHITISATGVNKTRAAIFTISGISTTSGNSYAGYVAANSTNMKFPSDGRIRNTSSNGTIRSIEIVWATNTGSPQVKVKGGASPFQDKDETITLQDKITYGSGVTTIDWSEKDNQYFYIDFANVPSTGAIIADIIIGWEPTPSYSTTSEIFYLDERGVSHPSPDPIYGEVAEVQVASTAKAGDRVAVKVTPGYIIEDDGSDWEYEMVSVYAGTKLLTNPIRDDRDYSWNYSFTMPESDVNIAVTVRKPLERNANEISGITDQDFISGASGTLSFSCTAGASYDGTATVESTDPTILTITQVTNNSFTYKAYNRGQAFIQITLPQTDTWYETDATITINVAPQEMVLIAEDAEGNFAALQPDANNTFAGLAIKTLDVNGSLYTTEDPESLKWLVCEHKDGYYTIERSENNFLGYGNDVEYTHTYNYNSQWTKDANGQFIWHGLFTLSSDGTHFNTDSKTNGIKAYNTVGYAPLQTLRSVTADAFSTTCQPYSFIAGEGLELYEIDNIEKGHIYFCRLDAGEITTAGQPYIIKSQTTEAKAYKIGDEGAAAGTHNGLYGVDENTTWNYLWTNQPSLFYNSNVMVFKKDGSIAHVEYDTTRGGGGGIAGHSACILLSEVNHDASTCSPADSGAAPRRVSLAVEESQVPTAVENTLNATGINWNEPVYNIMGQRVARGTTGVLVQNGKKFIAE